MPERVPSVVRPEDSRAVVVTPEVNVLLLGRVDESVMLVYVGSTVIAVEGRLCDETAVDEGPDRIVSKAVDDRVSTVWDRLVMYDGMSE